MAQNANRQKNTADRVRALVMPISEEMGYLLWDVEYVKEGASWHLRISIEHAGDDSRTISIDDCERFHRAIDPILDEADPIEENYYLEVSSAGVERELKRSEHFLVCMGQTVEVRLFAQKNGQKVYTGTLHGYDEGSGDLTLNYAGEMIVFVAKEYGRVSTVYDFSQDLKQ